MTRDYSRLDAFLQEREKDIGWTLEDSPHEEIAHKVIEQLYIDGYIFPGAIVLDVGCGNGRDLRHFDSLGCISEGVTLGPFKKSKDLIITEGDQSFLPYFDGLVDFLFARHILEHSVMPYFTLCEYNRVLRTNGYCYVEVPAPNTSGAEINHNHYSIFDIPMWEELMKRAGFKIIETTRMNLKTSDGVFFDTWFKFILQKISEPWKGWAAKELGDVRPDAR